MESRNTDKSGNVRSPLSPLNIVVAIILVAGALFFVNPTSDDGQPTSDDVLFSLEGIDYRAEDLPLKYSQRLYDIERNSYLLKEKIISAAVAEAYLEQQQEKTGESRETLINRLFQPTAPADEAIRQFYEQNKSRIRVPPEQARQQIVAVLMANAQQQKQQQLMAKLQGLDELQINLQPPHAPFAQLDTEGYPSRGAADAKVTLVEFADYQCPHCRNAHLVLKELLEPWLDRVRYVYMDFPINRSGISRKVAEGAVCADAQGAFWEYQDLAYEHQQQLSIESPRQLAEQLQLDLNRFDSCYSADSTAARVKRAEQQAIAAGVTGTPSFFINGKKLSLRNFRSDLEQQIREALEVSGA